MRDVERCTENLRRQVAALQQRITDGGARGTETVSEAVGELGGTLEELIATHEDLRRQHAEGAAARRDVESDLRRARALFDLAPVAYLTTDHRGVIQEANGAAATLLASSSEVLVGMPLVLFVSASERAAFSRQLRRLLQERQVQDWEVHLQPRPGALFPAAITVVAAADAAGHPPRLHWVLRDLTPRQRLEAALRESREALEKQVAARTAYLHCVNEHLLAEIAERKRIETALRENEQRFRAIFDQAGMGIALLGLDGKWLLVNQRFCDLVGYASEELYDQTWEQTTHPADVESGAAFLHRILAGELQSYCREKRYITKNGDQIWGRLTVSLVREPSGPPRYLVGIVEDITAHKLAEDKTRRAEQALRKSRGQLRRLATYLQNSQERERARIARALHDDLAQSLTALNMDVAWLSRRLTRAPKPQRERIRAIVRLIDSLHKSVRRIGTELRPTLLDDLGLTAALEWQLQDIGRRTGLLYTLDTPAEEVPLKQECATALFRIFQEALINVVRHAKATRVRVRLERQSAVLLLEVADNGKGITPEQLDDPSSLGLLGIRERAALWEGDVAIHGQAGAGTTVTVRFPYAHCGGEPT